MVALDLMTNDRNFEQQRGGTSLGNDEGVSSAREGLGQAGLTLAGEIVSAIERHVLPADTFGDLAVRLGEVKHALHSPSGPEDLIRSGSQINSVLESFQVRVRGSNLQTAEDFQKVLSLLNESFSCIQAGDAKADERLKYFEKGLGEAAKMDSLVSLRLHLSKMIEFARTESKVDLLEKETKRKTMTEQMRQAQDVHSRLRLRLPGRLEAIEYMRESTAGAAEGSAGLFVVDSLRALRERHGEGVAANILDELGRKQVHPLAPDGKLFCWGGSSLALVSRPQAGGSKALLGAVPSVFEHRAFIGTRVATFRVNVRSISLSLSPSVDTVIATLDAFCKENAA